MALTVQQKALHIFAAQRFHLSAVTFRDTAADTVEIIDKSGDVLRLRASGSGDVYDADTGELIARIDGGRELAAVSMRTSWTENPAYFQ